ncbi:hypothetical protein TraAM80_00457 [Trypanosoma rangeli]|uniref:Uncharacterized protein n=1 Tax=Trypanosoma rangeli TaxID=5698 RepID=A0A422P367_TRYRA|nr:uncharacterized protein TraAM80_00457 [Trypanosoma rangeli]RNF12176.1 hypothetical protein TraAM80_00457 [Trypanosoma rangeli]|eukprot:RNF12176.1 hypothetical protein TraAM80_00457 [Trypanosoma rangeli]
MLTKTALASDVLVPHSVLNGMFDNAMFPMRTLYCPPVPPSMLVGRYRPPPRPGIKYRNDLSLAGPREHWAQSQVSRMWRGVITRRRLRNERNYFHVRTRRAIMIQCWWRRLRAIWRRRSLQRLLDEWVLSRAKSMVEQRLADYGVMMTWQRKRFENAVTKVQRVYRWYCSRRKCAFMDPEESPREPLPFPLRIRKKVYFPWRPRADPNNMAESKAAVKNLVPSSSKGRSTSIQFRKNRKGPEPPTVEEAKVINDAMREREARHALMLSQPEVQDRLQWKRDGLRLNDFDHNAGMIQRMVKSKWDVWKKTTRKVTSDYFNDRVRIIQRSFRVFKTLRQMREAHIAADNRAARKNKAYANAKLAQIEEDIVWQFNLFNNAARTIQMYWARYKFQRQVHNPFMMLEQSEAPPSGSPPPPPPYNLISEHIERENILRDAAKSRMEREMEATKKRIRKLFKRYVPQSVEIVSGEGVFLPARNGEEESKAE